MPINVDERIKIIQTKLKEDFKVWFPRDDATQMAQTTTTGTESGARQSGEGSSSSEPKASAPVKGKLCAALFGPLVLHARQRFQGYRKRDWKFVQRHMHLLHQFHDKLREVDERLKGPMDEHQLEQDFAEICNLIGQQMGNLLNYFQAILDRYIANRRILEENQENEPGTDDEEEEQRRRRRRNVGQRASDSKPKQPLGNKNTWT